MAGRPKRRAGATLDTPKLLRDYQKPEQPSAPKAPRHLADLVPADQADKRPPRVKLEELGIDGFCDLYVGDLRSLRDIARRLGVTTSSIMQWIDADPERRARYMLAREEQAEALASEIVQIADEVVPMNALGIMDSAAVQDKRVRMEARKWVAAKLKPKSYGEKIDVTSGGNPLQNMTEQQIDARLQMLLAKFAPEPKE